MDKLICKKCNNVLPISFKFCPSCGRPTVDPPKNNRRRPKGCGSTYKLKGNRTKPWVAKLDGKIIGYFEDKPSAETYLASHRTCDPSMLALTVKQIYERVKLSQSFIDLARGSQKNIEGAWGKFTEIEKRKMRDIKTTDFQNVIKKATENGCGRDGCSKIKSLASMICQNALLDDIITRDYSEGIELPQRVEYVKRRNFTFDEIIALFYNDTNRTARIVLCMIYMGVRISELFGIKKSNVHLDSSQPYVIGGEKTEAGKNRIIPIKEEILPYIMSFMNENGEYLFSSESGKHMNVGNFRQRDFYPLFDHLGFDYKDENGNNMLTPHRTRHTYISESIAAGVKPEILKLVVGQVSYSTSVERYGKETRPEVMQSEVKKSF